MKTGRLIITHACVAGRDNFLGDYSVVCENGRIIDVLPSRLFNAGPGAFVDAAFVDAKGQYLVPGFIDLHMHGFGGKLAKQGPAALAAICRELPRCGVTAVLPAITPGVLDSEYKDEYSLLEDLAKTKTEGTEVPGFLLEGHFLKLTGAIQGMTPEYTPVKVQALKKAAAPKRAVFGVSPEIPGIVSLLPGMLEGGTPAFITHTCADFEQTENVIEAGALHATHFYDVFPYPGEQEPGVRGCGAAEAIMSKPQVTVDFILDGEHVHPGAVKMALACKGFDKVCLITDANLNAGMPPGIYRGLEGTDIEMKYLGGPARGLETGGLTGSGLTMDLALKNAVKMLDLPLYRAAALVSANPATVLGLDNERGRIETGYRADFNLLDRDLNVTACYINGNCAYMA